MFDGVWVRWIKASGFHCSVAWTIMALPRYFVILSYFVQFVIALSARTIKIVSLAKTYKVEVIRQLIKITIIVLLKARRRSERPYAILVACNWNRMWLLRVRQRFMQFLLHAIKIALIKQVWFYRMQLHAFALCRKGVRLWCNAIIATTKNHMINETWRPVEFSELSLSIYIYGTLTPSHKSGKKWGKVSGPYAVCRSAPLILLKRIHVVNIPGNLKLSAKNTANTLPV